MKTTLALLLALLCVAPAAPAQEDNNKPRPRRGFFDPQLALAPDGGVALLWSRPAGAGRNLYLSWRAQGTSFGDPVQLNDRPGQVADWDSDEHRPAAAAAEDGRMAVAWAERDGSIRLAHRDGAGQPWRHSTLSEPGGRPLRQLPVLAWEGRELHAAWIDLRDAPRGQLEPATLVHAVRGRKDWSRLRLGALEGGVCGCCRPALDPRGRGVVELWYRSRGGDGLQDPRRLRISPAQAAGEPLEVGRPEWRLPDCTGTGVAAAGGVAVWRDASPGAMRIMGWRSAGEGPVEIAHDDAGWASTASPRRVPSDARDLPLFLLPGEPHAKLVALDDGRWVQLEELPTWCRSAVLVGDELLMVGDIASELFLEAYTLDWSP